MVLFFTEITKMPDLALWRDYDIQPSKKEITVIPKTAKNHSSYSQGLKLTIFNSFRGLELPKMVLNCI